MILRFDYELNILVLVSTLDMRRVGFRRVLPIVFTVAHLVLIWFTAAQEPRRTTNILSEPSYSAVAYQEGTGIPTMPLERPPLHPVQRIAIILELPVMFLALLIGGVLFPRNEMAWMYVSIAFVPPVWYCIGRWLDGLLGYIAPLRLSRTLRGLVALPSAGFLCLAVGGVTPLYHHRTTDSYWVFTGTILWCVLCLSITISSPDE